MVERLKEVLFKDTLLSRKKYLTLRKISRHNFYASIEEWDCCQCEYQQCSHYDDVLYNSKASRKYYKATCLSGALKISSQCNRFWGCCIAKMQNQKAFYDFNQALWFVYHCYHFQYEQSYINFCLEGNLFKNSRRHVLYYFDNIDRPEDLSSQHFKTITLSDCQVNSHFQTFIRSIHDEHNLQESLKQIMLSEL